MWRGRAVVHLGASKISLVVWRDFGLRLERLLLFAESGFWQSLCSHLLPPDLRGPEDVALGTKIQNSLVALCHTWAWRGGRPASRKKLIYGLYNISTCYSYSWAPALIILRQRPGAPYWTRWRPGMGPERNWSYVLGVASVWLAGLFGCGVGFLMFHPSQIKAIEKQIIPLIILEKEVFVVSQIQLTLPLDKVLDHRIILSCPLLDRSPQLFSPQFRSVTMEKHGTGT